MKINKWVCCDDKILNMTRNQASLDKGGSNPNPQ